MCDGWQGPTNMHIINFLVYSSRGTVFHKPVDDTNVYKNDVNYYFRLMKKVVEGVGEERVVQIVTDNQATMKVAGKQMMEAFPHLYWTACATHCLDLLLEDLGNLKNIDPVMKKAKKIS
ncbi:UDP-N-acetylmuramoylalanine--D-glutamate ligase [Bienertia sinuspersici]